MEVYICTNLESARCEYDDGSGDDTGVNSAADAAFEAAIAAGVPYANIHFSGEFRKWNGGSLHGNRRVAVLGEDVDTPNAVEAVRAAVRGAYDAELRDWEMGEICASFKCVWEDGCAYVADGEAPPARLIDTLVDLAEEIQLRL